MKLTQLMTCCAIAGFAAITQTQSVHAQGCPPNSSPVSEADNVVHCRCISGFENRSGVCERVTAQAKPLFALIWEDKKHPERSAWSDELRRAIKPNIPVLETAADISNYAPNYANLSESQRIDVWASLFVAIANFESPGFKPDKKYVEKKVRDKKGNLVTPFPSVGLLMLSYKQGEQEAYGYEPLDKKLKSLEDPLVNLRCGVKVLTYWVKRDGVIAGGSEQAPRGGARYWSVLREGKEHHLKEIQEMVKKQAMSIADPDAQKSR